MTPYRCALCGRAYVVPSLARDCEERCTAPDLEHDPDHRQENTV